MKILDAYKIAAQLHARDVDKAGRPIIEHLSRVFLFVLEAGGERIHQIGALFHEAIEDGRATIETLLAAGLPSESVDLVLVLSRRAGEDYVAYIRRVMDHPDAVLIKVGDVDDNVDPQRLALLPVQQAESLRKRYERALAMLATTPRGQLAVARCSESAQASLRRAVERQAERA